MKLFNRNISLHLATGLFIGLGIGYDVIGCDNHTFILMLPFITMEIRIKKPTLY